MTAGEEDGKELLKMHGYDCYDYGARHSYTALGRFTTPDPLAENDPGTSPYVLCKGNPVRFIDPDGRESFLAGFIGYVRGLDEKIDQAFKGGCLNVSADISVGVQMGAEVSVGALSVGADLDIMSIDLVSYRYCENQSDKNHSLSSGIHSDYVEVSQEASVNIGVPVI